jgi:hypothetical protein
MKDKLEYKQRQKHQSLWVDRTTTFMTDITNRTQQEEKKGRRIKLKIK